MVGDASYQIVFVWLVLSISHSPAVLAAVLVATSVPRATLLLLGGAVSDRVSARTVMFFSHMARGVALAILATLALTSGLRVWQLACVGVLFGIADAFFGPASGSILPSLVEGVDLPRANALVGVSEQAASFIGPVLGGALLTATSSSVALALNAATFFLASFTILCAPKTGRSGAHQSSVAALLSEMRGGVIYAARNVEVRMVLLLVTAATLSYSGAVGASITGLPRRWGRLIIGMTFAEGTCFAVLGFAPHYLLAAALLGLLGIGVAYSTDVALPTFIQTRTPRPLLGRVNSVITLPRFALQPVSITAMGALALLGARWTFALAAIPMLVVAILLASSRTARHLSADDPDSRETGQEEAVRTV